MIFTFLRNKSNQHQRNSISFSSDGILNIPLNILGPTTSSLNLNTNLSLSSAENINDITIT